MVDTLFKQRIAKLKRRAKAWGGQLIKLTYEGYDCNYHVTYSNGFKFAPFGSDGALGVVYDSKSVYYSDDCLITEIIHEMAHVFACNDKPENSKEWNFFGWEWALAMSIGLTEKEFKSGNKFYNTVEFGHKVVGDLSLKDFQEMIEEVVALSKSNGLIKGRKPIAIR